MYSQQQSYSVPSLKQNGCFGEYASQAELTSSKILFYGSTMLSLLGLVLLLLGAFTRELAGLEQMVLFQTIFADLLFSGQKVTRAVLSMRGFQYSLGLKIPLSFAEGANTSDYLLEVSGQAMADYYLVNFLLYLLPLASLFYLLYKLRYKSFPFKNERGRHAEEFFRG
jgi:hypothetical protein